MSVADQGLGSIVNGLTEGDGANGVIILEGTANVRTDRTGATNGSFGENSYYSTMLGTGNSEGLFSEGGYNTISGGDTHYVRGHHATIGGGAYHNVSNEGESFIGYGTIGGGQSNEVHGSYATIAGGDNNEVRTPYGFLGGGSNNYVMSNDPDNESQWYSTLGGGYQNIIWGGFGFLGGGADNRIGQDDEGGQFNPTYAVLTGGQGNRALGHYTGLLSGRNNIITQTAGYSVLAGGEDHQVYDHHGFIGGGQGHYISAAEVGENSGHQSIGGGYGNQTWGRYNVVGGGITNLAGTGEQSSLASVIAGGEQNVINGANRSAIGGGHQNVIDFEADHGVIPGGLNNRVSAQYGQASGLAATARLVGQRAFAGGQYNGEDPGARQTSELVLRGNTTGTLAESVYLGTGGDSAEPDTSAFALQSEKTYILVADCLARDPASSSSMHQVIRGLIHMDGSVPGLAGDSIGDKLEVNGPPPEWEFGFATDEGGWRLTFTVGEGNSNTVHVTAGVRMTEVGAALP